MKPFVELESVCLAVSSWVATLLSGAVADLVNFRLSPDRQLHNGVKAYFKVTSKILQEWLNLTPSRRFESNFSRVLRG